MVKKTNGHVLFKILSAGFIFIMALTLFNFQDTRYESERKLLSMTTSASCENVDSDYIAEEISQSINDFEILGYTIEGESNTGRCSYIVKYIQHNTPNIYQIKSTDMIWWQDCTYTDASEHVFTKHENILKYNYITHEKYGFACIVTADYYVER